MARQQTLTKFLTNPPRPSNLRSKKQTKTVLDLNSPPIGSMDETDSNLPITHFMQNPASRCAAVSSPASSRAPPASPAPMGTMTLSSDGDSLEPVRWKRKRKLNRVIMESDSEDELPYKRRRLLQRGLRPDKDDEDDKPDATLIIEGRLRTRSRKSAFSRKLEKLRRQRQGLSLESDEENEEGREYRQNHLNIIPGAQPAQGGTTNTPSDDDDDTDDFIVDDEDGPQHIDLPTNFSSSGIQPLASSFKVVFQLLVHVSCLEPHLRGEGMKRLVGNSEHAEYFQSGLHQLRRRLTSTRDSFASSLWSQEFRRQLEIFPECEVVTIEPETYCDACRRGAAVSTRQMRLLGNHYDEGYEPLEEVSDSISEWRNKAHIVLNLGQHCARRVELFHRYSHWEWSLFRVIENIIESKIKKPARLRNGREWIKTSDWGQPKSIDEPDAIVEWLDDKGVISEQWRVIRALMEEAKNVDTKRAGEVD